MLGIVNDQLELWIFIIHEDQYHVILDKIHINLKNYKVEIYSQWKKACEREREREIKEPTYFLIIWGDNHHNELFRLYQ